MSASEPIDDVQEDVDVDRILARCEKAFGARYGGAVIERRGPRSWLRVLVVHSSEADRQRLRRIAGTPRVRLGTARYGEAAANRIKDRLTRVIIRHNVQPALVGFDEERQRFLIWAKAIDHRTRALLDAIAPPPAIAYQIGGEFNVSQRQAPASRAVR